MTPSQKLTELINKRLGIRPEDIHCQDCFEIGFYCDDCKHGKEKTLNDLLRALGKNTEGKGYDWLIDCGGGLNRRVFNKHCDGEEDAIYPTGYLEDLDLSKPLSEQSDKVLNRLISLLESND